MRTGKPAAVIALAICVVSASATCGATGAPTTGPWFLPLPNQSPRERDKRRCVRVRSATIPRRAPELGRNFSERVSHALMFRPQVCSPIVPTAAILPGQPGIYVQAYVHRCLHTHRICQPSDTGDDGTGLSHCRTLSLIGCSLPSTGITLP
jgi:hypothetical protein